MPEWGTAAQAVVHEISSSDGLPSDGVFCHGTSSTGSPAWHRGPGIVHEGGVVTEIAAYDGASDRVGAVAAPRRGAEPPLLTHYSYDALCRTLRVEYPTARPARSRTGSGSVTFCPAHLTPGGHDRLLSRDPYERITGVRENRRQCFLSQELSCGPRREGPHPVSLRALAAYSRSFRQCAAT